VGATAVICTSLNEGCFFFNYDIESLAIALQNIGNSSEIYTRVNICAKISEFLSENFDLISEKTTPCLLLVHRVFLFFLFFGFVQVTVVLVKITTLKIMFSSKNICNIGICPKKKGFEIITRLMMKCISLIMQQCN
jgi:hypothetical protein